MDLKMALGLLYFWKKLSNSRLGFMWAAKIRHSWWRIKRAPRLFATHWVSLMISAWPGFVSELRAHCLLFSRPRRPADGPAAAQRLLSPAPFVLHHWSVLYARAGTTPSSSWAETLLRRCHKHYDRDKWSRGDLAGCWGVFVRAYGAYSGKENPSGESNE